MKKLLWIVILFAVAIALAIVSNSYSGNVFVVADNHLLRINLHLFIIGIIVFVAILYIAFRILAAVGALPSVFGRFQTNRQSRKAMQALNAAGLAYFEGKFQKSEREAAKVLANKGAKNHHLLALMLAAQASEQMNNNELCEKYLAQLEKQPAKQQLSRYLLLAEHALNRADLKSAEEHLLAAAQINGNLTQLNRLQLRLALAQNNALEVISKTNQLEKSGVISADEALSLQCQAYAMLLDWVNDIKGLKACLKRIPNDFQRQQLGVAIAQKYVQLGLYQQAYQWIKEVYPKNPRVELLLIAQKLMGDLNEKTQRQAIDSADLWLKNNPKNADLLRYLGELSFQQKLWGKAQSYFEAALSIQPDMTTHLSLAKVFDAIDESNRANEQRQLALQYLDEDMAE